MAIQTTVITCAMVNACETLVSVSTLCLSISFSKAMSLSPSFMGRERQVLCTRDSPRIASCRTLQASHSKGTRNECLRHTVYVRQSFQLQVKIIVRTTCIYLPYYSHLPFQIQPILTAHNSSSFPPQCSLPPCPLWGPAGQSSVLVRSSHKC